MQYQSNFMKERLIVKIFPFFQFQTYYIIVFLCLSNFIEVVNVYSFYLIVPLVFTDFLVLLFVCFRCF